MEFNTRSANAENIYKTPRIPLTRKSKALAGHITASEPQRPTGKSEQVCHDLFSDMN